MISIDNISFSYNGKNNIINSFSLEIPSGSRICLYGESGCGKTTLLRLLLGLEAPTGGKIIFKNKYKASAVFQENRLLPFKTVLNNIILVGAEHKTALKHLKALGIADYADKYPHELSGGMQRRAALARALSADFDYLVLDEAFTGLDDSNIASAAAHISATLGNRILIMVTHSKTEAELLGAKIIYM